MADLDTSLSLLQESVQALHDANIAAEAVGAIADSVPSSEASYHEAGLSQYDQHDTLSLCESAEVSCCADCNAMQSCTSAGGQRRLYICTHHTNITHATQERAAMILEDVAAEKKNSRVVEYFTAQVRALKKELSCKDKVVSHPNEICLY
jgi:hypothetical protein